MSIHQYSNESITEYFVRFDTYAQKLDPKMDLESQKLIYWKGLKFFIQRKIELNSTITLEEVHVKAKTVEARNTINYVPTRNYYSQKKYYDKSQQVVDNTKYKQKVNSEKPQSKPVCTYCNKVGHTKEECRYRISDEQHQQEKPKYKSYNKNKSEKYNNSSATNSALFLQGSVNGISCKVIVDTGSALIMENK